MSINDDDPFSMEDNIPTQPESKPGIPAISAPQGAKGTLRDQALATVPPVRHGILLTSAVDAKVVDPDDPAWWIIAAAVNIADAVEHVAQSSDEVQIQLASLPSNIQKAVISGGNDLQGVINQTSIKFVAAATAAVQKAVEQATLEASAKLINDASKAAASIKDVVNSLPTAVKEQRDAAVKEYAASGATAAQAAVSATRWRGKAWAGFSFLTVLLVGGLIGGYVAVTGGESLHFIQPVGLTALVINDKNATGLGIKAAPNLPNMIKVYPETR
ncbi:MAG: hypothetical protein M0Z50_19140 [Planctomycetia bacterium]|nr:hypothetical protein [Planctomycetia bacterium]